MSCFRCGKCCQNLSPDVWKKGDADGNGEQQDCGKLIFIEGEAFCEVYDNRPQICIDYPKGTKQCLGKTNGN